MDDNRGMLQINDYSDAHHNYFSNMAFAVINDVQNADRRRKELRNVLEINDRKKF